MLPFLLQSPFPQTKCTGTCVERGSKAFTKFSKGVQSQESIKYWAAVRNKPTWSWWFGTPLCAARGRRERGEARGTISQFRQPNCTDSAQITKDTPSGRARMTGQRSRENPSSQQETQENVCTLTCPTKTRKSALGKDGWMLHLNYSVIKTSNSQGRQEKIHALTHKVAWLELVSQDCCKGRAW